VAAAPTSTRTAPSTEQPRRLSALLSTLDITGEEAEQATDDLFSYETTAAVVQERDRTQLERALPGDGYHVIVEIHDRDGGAGARVDRAFDVRRPRGGDVDSWRIIDITRLTFVQGLYRLRLDASTQYCAREFTIRAQDVQFTLHTGYVFEVISGEGVTGLVLLGRGEMQFSPGPPTERGQLRIFGGSETLTAAFGTAFVRVHPADFETRVDVSGLTGMPADPRQARRAQDVFAIEAPKSFNIDLRDLSRETWYILPQTGDFLAEVRTNKFGTLTYSRSGGKRRGRHAVRPRAQARHRTVCLAVDAWRCAVPPTTKTTCGSTTRSTTTSTRWCIRSGSSSKAART
jgi:hypothetical protein